VRIIHPKIEVLKKFKFQNNKIYLLTNLKLI